MLKVIPAIIPLFFFSFSKAQTNELKEDFGATAGITFSIGTMPNRIGAFVQAYYYYDIIQINGGLRVYYNFNSFGPEISHSEAVTNIGFTIAYGDSRAEINKFISPISNQTKHKYSFSYNYRYYLNQIKTSQPTGVIALGIDKIQISHENDIFGKQAQDQFRTAAVAVMVRQKYWRAGVTVKMWTGARGKKVKNSNYPSRYGYMDLSKALHGKYSHGILAVRADYALKYLQTANINVGLDSEYIRHFLQNKLMHDMIFLPRKWNKAENVHIPMLDEQSKPYIFKENQKVKKTKPFVNIGLNKSLFY